MKASDARVPQTYHQEDIQQILQIAMSRQDHDGEFSREQLLEIAAELEISSESLQAAEQQWLANRGELQKRQAFNIHRRRKLQKRFGNYAIANSFIVMLDFVNGGDLSWSLYILLLWGLKLGLDSWNTYQSQGEEYERAFQVWYRQNQLKQTVSSLMNKWFRAWQI